MAPSPQRTTLSTERPDLIERLRQVLDSTGFTHEQVRDALPPASPLTSSAEYLPFLSRTIRDSPIAPFVHLFLVCDPVPAEAVAAALAPLTLDDARTWAWSWWTALLSSPL